MLEFAVDGINLIDVRDICGFDVVVAIQSVTKLGELGAICGCAVESTNFRGIGFVPVKQKLQRKKASSSFIMMTDVKRAPTLKKN